MRLFVALAISGESRQSIAALIQRLRETDAAPRWINPHNAHITLKFIGEVRTEKLKQIGDALATVRLAEPVTLQIRGLGFFPNARRPAVAWIGLEPPEPLVRLAGHVDRALSTVQIPPEERPFVPHLTVARFKQARVSPALAARFEKEHDQRFGSVFAKEFHLMESKLKSSGAEYTTLRSFDFVAD